MNKKQVLKSLLAQLSLVELTNALRVLKALSQHNLLQPKYIDALLRISDEMNLSSSDFVESITISTSGELDQNILLSLVSEDKKLIIQEQESDDIFISISGSSACYKRSLNYDIDKLLS